MILQETGASIAWSPLGFEKFAARYPATPWTPPSPALDRTPQLIARWKERAAPPPSTAVVLTPGLYSEWLPSCFAGARRGFEQRGHRALRSAVRSSRGIDAQAGFLEDEISRWLRPGERFVWLAHSKGALDALWCVQRSATIRERCVGLVAMQPAVGRSWVMESWRNVPQSLSDRAMRRLLDTRWLRGGSRECTTDRDPCISEWLATFAPVVPTLHVVTWSVEPTSWVDSFHARLEALRPGCAHDGQFYLPDQLLRDAPVVTLPRLDHAQPVLGGRGLDVARLWRALAQLVMDHTR